MSNSWNNITFYVKFSVINTYVPVDNGTTNLMDEVRAMLEEALRCVS